MQLKVKDGQLSLGSVYKLFVVGWTVAWTAFFGGGTMILMVVVLVTGEATMNEEIVYGRIPALLALAPMFVFFPVVVFLQSFLFAAVFTGGVWLYRLRRPLNVIIEGGAD